MSKSTSRIVREKGSSFKPLVYICAPFSGDVETNVQKAVALAKKAYQDGCIPLTPHLLFPFLNDRSRRERQDALFMDLVLMGKCQEVWVLADTISNGMKKEIEVATYRHQTIRYFNKDYMEVEYETSLWQ